MTLVEKGEADRKVSECRAPGFTPGGRQLCYTRDCRVFGVAAAPGETTAVGRPGLGYNEPPMPYSAICRLSRIEYSEYTSERIEVF